MVAVARRKTRSNDAVVRTDVLGNRNQHIVLLELRQYHTAMARFALREPLALPIFERLDRELRAAEARIGDDPVAAARAMLQAQYATR